MSVAKITFNNLVRQGFHNGKDEKQTLENVVVTPVETIKKKQSKKKGKKYGEKRTRKIVKPVEWGT